MDLSKDEIDTGFMDNEGRYVTKTENAAFVIEVKLALQENKLKLEQVGKNVEYLTFVIEKLVTQSALPTLSTHTEKICELERWKEEHKVEHNVLVGWAIAVIALVTGTVTFIVDKFIRD